MKLLKKIGILIVDELTRQGEMMIKTGFHD